ncbi:TIM-barrel domain-containing protein [Teredinibacter turnerae]|uniref:TIM-barrel domain-containing protein n=1 Tax=Teredinibacter turnerae TaxID=2426 RepID=UPI0005F77C04|nr:TIM-barrel domain-containing protein [Teredinibacter turnerae]
MQLTHLVRSSFLCTQIALTSLLLACSQSTQLDSANNTPDLTAEVTRTEHGIIVHPRSGAAKAVRLQIFDENIIRVTSSPDDTIELPASIMVNGKPRKVPFNIKETEKAITLQTPKMSVQIAIADGKIVFTDNNGKRLQTLNSGKFGPVTRDPSGVPAGTHAISQSFSTEKSDAFYGLGQQQNGQVNLAGENLYLTTYNLIITIPFLTSSKPFAILWDNNSDSRFGDPEPAKPLFENFTLFNVKGEQGALTARYFDGDQLLLERDEKDLNYQFLSNNSIREFPLPKVTETAKDLRIEWLGSIQSNTSGTQEILMYSSGYAKLSIDNTLLLDRWRMNWNPWYHNTKVAFARDQKKSFKLEWEPGGGYMRVLSHAPSAESRKERITFSSDVAKAIDYYVVAGQSKDEQIAGYRQLTGKSVLLPRWAYGFWQSRERYKSSDEIVTAVKEYRSRKIPLDNIVLDWSYWPVDAWGSHDFDKTYFPDPSALVNQVHDLNAHIMISVWPKFYPTTDNYKALDKHGFMLNRNIEEGNKDWIYPGFLNGFYDAYNPDARALFWQQLDAKINQKGFDAWWLDAVEPDIHSNVSWNKRKELMSPNHAGTGAQVFNAYAVPHAESVYQGDRASAPDTRVFILTRSGFGGIQRTASAIWSGDTVSRWSNLHEQIAAGINTGLAGMPNWTFDIGGFTPEDRYRSFEGKSVGPYTEMDPSQLPEWQELNTRWYQLGAFLPIYRSHGQNPYREIYNIAAEGSEAYDSMVWYTQLRYRLLPYIYSQAGDMFHKDATLMRGLAMDFPTDSKAASINDAYLFGPHLLVAPISDFGKRERQVYLPKGTLWYDFYDATLYKGGRTITAEAPLSRIPLYVKAGSILVTGPKAQFAEQTANGPLTITVYTGADGEFELYEDDGESYDYEKGAWSRIPLHYDDQSKQLTIGARLGEFNGMAKERDLSIRWISAENSDSANFDKLVSQTVRYRGKPLQVTLGQ